MKTKIIFIFVITLLLVATVLPAAGNLNVIENQNHVVQDPLESEPQYSTTSRVDDEWSMFQHDLGNTGYSTSIAPQTNTVKWTYTTGAWVTSNPAVANGKVYISPLSADGNFYCLDADTGEKIWDYPMSGGIGSDLCPAVYDGKVYVACDFYNIYCWDADTGDLIWTIPKPYGGACSPAVSDGKVYVSYGGNSWGVLLCLDADTGGEFWNYSFDEGILSPAVSNGKIYIGCNDGCLYCLDAENGELVWSYLGVDWMSSPPAVIDGKVYSNSDRGCCLDAETGKLLWRVGTLPRRVLGSPAVAYGRVYIYAEDVYCLDAENGEEIWKYPTGCSYGYSSPAVADGKVYVSICGTGKLVCLDAYTGEKIWDYYICSPIVLEGSPAVAYGRVYIGGGDTCKIYCFEDPPLPPNEPTITGKTNGAAGANYEYTFNAVDPNYGDDVKYHIDWGDGKSRITGFNPSGTDFKAKHIYYEEGTYTIRAKAEDTTGLESDWSELTVTMPRNKISIYNSLFLRFLQQFLILSR